MTIRELLERRDDYGSWFSHDNRSDQRNTSGIVYFIEAIGLSLIKIGWAANDPKKRMKNLQCGSPVELRMAGGCEGTQKEEAMLHKHLDQYRVRGEWFAVCPTVEDEIRKLDPGFILTGSDNGVKMITEDAAYAEYQRGHADGHRDGITWCKASHKKLIDKNAVAQYLHRAAAQWEVHTDAGELYELFKTIGAVDRSTWKVMQEKGLP